MLSPTLVRPSYMPKYVPDPSCKLWLPGQDDPQSTTIRDRSGNGNHGTIYGGAPWKRLPKGLWCLSYDGSDDCVDLGDVSDLDFAGDSSFTVMAWVKRDTQVSRAIMSKFDWGNDKGWMLYTYNSKLRMALNQNEAILESTETLDDATWYFVVGVKSSTNPLKGYINGAEVSYGTQDNGVNVNSPTGLDCLIGQRQDDRDNGYQWQGNIGLPRAINAVLTVTQIAGIRNQERHLFGV